MVPPLPSARPSSPTLRDIAREAGVSPQTVSNFLSGRHSPRDATRERIEQALATMDYHPNAAARALAAQTVGSFALVLEDPNRLGLGEPLHAAFASGAAIATQEAGCTLTLSVTAPGETERVARDLVRERRADGAILSIGQMDDARTRAVSRIAQSGVPLVLLQQTRALPGVFTVAADDDVGASDAIEMLAALGHRRFAFLSATPSWPAPERRLAGVRRACEAVGAELETWNAAAYTVEAARTSVTATLAAGTSVTAVVAANDVLALGAVQGSKEAGLQVPGDVSIVGFNDSDFAAWVRPAITTVRVPGAEMAARAVQLLVRATRDGLTPEGVMFHTTLMMRETTAAPPA